MHIITEEDDGTYKRTTNSFTIKRNSNQGTPNEPFNWMAIGWYEDNTLVNTNPVVPEPDADDSEPLTGP